MHTLVRHHVLLGALIVLLGAGFASCAVAAASPGGSKATDVQITLTDFAIQSSITTFHVGTPYHLIVTNNGQAVHEVMIATVAAAHGSEEEVDASRLIEVADVDPGTTKTGDMTFKSTAAPGTLEMACHEPGHYESGMRLDISVR